MMVADHNRSGMPPIKVLHVFKTYFPDTYGGIEQVIKTLAENASQHGVQCTVLVLSPNFESDQIMPEGYRLIRCSQDLYVASTGLSRAFVRHFKALAAQSDIVHVHFPWPMADIAALVTRVRTPMVMTYHSDIVNQPWLEPFYAPLRHRFISRQSAIVATSPKYAASSSVLRRYRDRLHVIPIGIARPKVLPAASAVGNWQRHLGPKYFAFVGVPRYYKGLAFLLKALKRRDYPMVIGGGGGDQAQLAEQANALGLRQTLFAGVLEEDDKNALIAGAHALVLPSHKRSEAFGIVLAEASALGVPMLTCEIGTGTSFVNQHDLTGLVIPPRDVEALADALDRMWDDDSAIARWGQAARDRYSQEFSESTMTERYTSLYRDVLGRPAMGTRASSI